jgi:hypothetical protein
MRPILVGHAVDLATAPPPPTTTAKSKPTPPLTQRGLRSLDPGSDESVVDPAGEHADPGHPSTRLPAHRRPPRPHPGRTQRTRERGHRTPTADTGTPTADTGTPTADTGRRTLRRPHRTLDTVAWTDSRGDWTSAPDTGRRPLAKDVDPLTKARPASAPPWATTPSGPALGHPTVFLWTAPTALGAHDGSAVGPSAGARLPVALPSSCSVAPPAKPRLGALLSSEKLGVESSA